MPYELLEPEGRYEILPSGDTSLGGEVKQGVGNLIAGAVRGAGSIGATLLAPIDAAARAVGIQNDFIGRTDRRQAMTAALEGFGAEPDSLAFGAGKLGTEIAGTAGAGGMLAKGAQALGATRALSGLEPIVEGATRGLQTGGFRVGPLAGTGLGTATRLATGGAVGAATAGLVNPSDAGLGAAIGAALPGATALAGRAGSALRGTPQTLSPELQSSAREAIESGYVIPPASVNPTFRNRTLETISGKQATQQLASVRNAEVSRDLVKRELGIASDAPLNRESLEAVRKEAGKAYQAIANLPVVPAQPGSRLMNIPATQAIKPRELVHDLKAARNESQAWYKAYNANPHPDTLAKAKALEAQAEAIENTLEKYAASRGANDLLPALREARKKIAQTYTVERALNEATGSVDATVLGKLFQKGKPVSGELEKVARFGSAFPTVAKLPEKIGSPDTHNLRSVASLFLGGGGMAAGGPAGLVAGAIPYVAPPVARSVMFSRPVQRGLLAVPPAPDDVGLLTTGASRVLPLLSAQ